MGIKSLIFLKVFHAVDGCLFAQVKLGKPENHFLRNVLLEISCKTTLGNTLFVIRLDFNDFVSCSLMFIGLSLAFHRMFKDFVQCSLGVY